MFRQVVNPSAPTLKMIGFVRETYHDDRTGEYRRDYLVRYTCPFCGCVFYGDLEQAFCPYCGLLYVDKNSQTG